MKAKLLLALSLLSSVASAYISVFVDPASEIPILDGYIEVDGEVAKFEFNGETARELYSYLPGSSIIRPDKVCSRGLKVPPTVKRAGGIHCERYVPETGQSATYKCFTSVEVATGLFYTWTEESICGISEEPASPEDEEKGFQKILSGAPLIGYQPVQLMSGMFPDEKKTRMDGNFLASSVLSLSGEFFFSGKTAQMLYEAMPKSLTVPKERVCRTGAKIVPTVRRSNNLRCLRMPSADKKSATYSCYTRLDVIHGLFGVLSEEGLCNSDPDI